MFNASSIKVHHFHHLLLFMSILDNIYFSNFIRPMNLVGRFTFSRAYYTFLRISPNHIHIMQFHSCHNTFSYPFNQTLPVCKTTWKLCKTSFLFLVILYIFFFATALSIFPYLFAFLSFISFFTVICNFCCAYIASYIS